MESKRRFLETFVYFLFVVSGACSLIYQLVWVRIFSLEFGSTTLGVATVVAVFLGGLAAGALAGGKISARLKRPLAAYGAIELMLTSFVALSPWTIAWALSTLLNSAGPLVHDSFGLLTLLRFVAAIVLLLPPTLLMGATLPVLSTWMEQRAGQGSYRASSLYSWNTFGATLGVAFGGFVLIPSFGMQKSLLIAAAANLFIAIFCLVAGRRIAPAKAKAASKKTRPVKDAPGDAADSRLILGGIGIALAGAAAMICQVVWTRVATLVLGASVYSFTVVLGVFLAGLALGALFVTWACHKKPQTTGAVLQALLMGGAVVVIATGFVFSFLPAWAVGLHSSINTGAGAFSLLQLQLAIAAALLFLPVLILGGIFPAALLALAREQKAIGGEVGRLYAWNIAGSVSGVLLAGFLLLPFFGVSISLGWAATLLLVAGLFYQQANLGLSLKKGAPVAIAMAVAIWLVLPPWDRQLMASGVHTYAPAYSGLAGPQKLAEHVRKNQEILYYADGMTATIMVTKDRAIKDRDVLYISTDGKMDGSSDLDMPTQRLAAHLPMLLHPAPQKVAIIGMGTGCSAGSASLYPQSQVRLIEIEAKMVEGSKFFLAHNHDVHNRENVQITVSDGRLHLLMQREVYDVVVSVPSNPWLAGSANLFTADFFARAAGALNEGGIFAQWIQTYGMSSENFQMVVRGFVNAFPQTLLATTIPGDVLLIGSKNPFDFDLEAISQRMNNPKIRADLADRRLNVRSAHDLMARIRVLPEFVQELAGQGPLHTDDHPVLAYRAPLDLHRDTWPKNEQLIGRHATGIAPALMKARGQDYALAHQQALADAYGRYLGVESKEAVYTRLFLQ